MNLDKLLSKYDYRFPEELIAQSPAHPRDAAQLLVYDRKSKKTNFDIYKNIGKYLPKGAVLVFNKTKVVPARLEVKKSTGGKAKLLYIDNQQGLLRFISDRKLNVGSNLYLTSKLFFEIKEQQDNLYVLKSSFPAEKVFSVLEKHGTTPIPPYIKHTKLSEKKLREEYQTVFAKQKGSVAAPTASLHFTKKLMASLKRQGFKICFVTLHVNLGTFATLTEKNIKLGKLHKEFYEIDSASAAKLNLLKKQGRPIFAVGTTVVRTLESAAKHGQLNRLSGVTDLFIQEGYKFSFVEGLITNFHVPKSSLMMLVSALLGRSKLLNLYRLAIKKRFRLFSFGDGMLIK